MRHNLRKLSKNNTVLNNGENKTKFSVYYKNNYHNEISYGRMALNFSLSKFHRTKSFELFTCLTK